MIDKFKFLNDLELIRRLEGSGKLFELTRAYSATFEVNGELHLVTAPKGMLTDFASIPKIARSIIDPIGPNIEAAIIHDHLCYLRGESGYTALQAAEIFLAGLEAHGVGWMKRKAMFNAVRFFGPSW